jgi:hypothetical protein
VIHLDPPQDEKDYIHRSGRTARAGAHGLVINFFRKEQLKPAAAMHRRLGVTVEQATSEQAQELLVEVRNLNAGIATGSEGTATETWTMATISEVDPMADEWVDSPGRSGFGDRDRPRSGGFDRDRGTRPSFGGYDRDRPRSGGFDRDRSSRPSFGDRPSFADRQRAGGFDRGPRPAGAGFGERSERPSFNRDRPNGDRPSFGADRDRGRPSGFDRARPAFGDRPERSERPSFDRGPRAGGFGDRTERADRGGFERPARPGGFDRSGPSRSFGADRPSFKDRAERGDRPSFGRDDRGTRSGPGGFGGERGDRPSFDRGPRPAGDRDRPFGARPTSDRSGSGFNRGDRDRPFSSGRPTGDRSGSGFNRNDRGGSGRPPFDRDRPRFGGFAGGDRPSFDRDRPRDGGFRAERPAFNRDREARPVGERDWKPRSSTPAGDRGYSPRPERPGGFRSDGGASSYGDRGRSDRPSFSRDRNAPFTGRSESTFPRESTRSDAGAVTAAPRPSWRSEGAGDGDRPKRVRPPRK